MYALCVRWFVISGLSFTLYYYWELIIWIHLINLASDAWKRFSNDRNCRLNFHFVFLLFNMGLWNLLNFCGGLVFFAGFQRVQLTMPGLNHGLQVEAGSDSDSFWQPFEGVAVCGWPTYFLWELVTKQDSTSRSQWQQRKCFHLVVTFPGQGANIVWHSIFRQTATTPLKMDVHPSENIFRELQQVLDTGFYDGIVSPEDHWHQVRTNLNWFHILMVTN